MTQATASSDKFLKVQKRAASVRQKYTDSASPFVNILAYGDFGTGKSSLAATAVRPVFIDSFDPGGTKTAVLQPLIESGDIIVENKWEQDSWKKPWAFREWEREMAERERDGFFDHIGTYMVDSITKWSDSMMYEILKVGSRKTGPRPGTTPEIQDYLTQQLTAVDWLDMLMGYRCNVLCTGHIGIDKDEITGATQTGMLLYGKLSMKVPLAFDEKYITRSKQGPSGIEYHLQTKNDGYWKAETRMGGSNFATFEQPDIRKLMQKAGKNTDDRPRLVD